MNNPLTKEELRQMVKDAGKPVVVWLDRAKNRWAMFNGAWFIDVNGLCEHIDEYGCNFYAYPDKPTEPPALTADEQATLRYICKVYPWARAIIREKDLLVRGDDISFMDVLPAAFLPALPKGCWEILIGEDGTVTLEAAKNENS